MFYTANFNVALSTDHTSKDVETILGLLIAVALVAVLTKYIRLPYTVVLVITGLSIALVPGIPVITLTPELIVIVFLPALLFEAAYNLSYKGLMEVFRLIGLLAFWGVLANAALVAGLLILFTGLPWQTALIFGSIVAATDPISVVATFRKLGTPHQLTVLIEGESLFNDGAALVLFNLLVGIVVSGNFDFGSSLTQFLVVAVGGLLFGAAVGYLALALLSHLNDYLTETLVTIIVAYGSFLAAEKLGLSPALAVVAAGLLVGNFGQGKAFSSTSRVAVGLSWELLGFLANSLIFLLVGLEIKAISFGNYWGVTLLAIGATFVGRVVVVFFFSGLNRILSPKTAIPFNWQLMLIWGGLRGSLSLALALSLPVVLASGAVFPDREKLLVMTFGVILFTLLVQGLTIEPLMKLLKLGSNNSEELYRHEVLHARGLALRSINQEIENMLNNNLITTETANLFMSEYGAKEEGVIKELEELHLTNELLQEEQMLTTRRHLLQFEKDLNSKLYREGIISADVLRELVAEIDAKSSILEQEGTHSNDSPKVELRNLITRLEITVSEKNSNEDDKSAG